MNKFIIARLLGVNAQPNAPSDAKNEVFVDDNVKESKRHIQEESIEPKGMCNIATLAPPTACAYKSDDFKQSPLIDADSSHTAPSLYVGEA